MKYIAYVLVLGSFLCYPASAAQMTIGDLYKLCTSSNEGDKSACRFYILGVFEGAQMVGGTVQDKSGGLQEAKDKRFCVPEGLSSWLAHLDPKTIADPNALAARAKLTLPDLERGFQDTEEILLRVSALYDGTIGELKYIGGNDYEVALDWIRRAKCAWIEKYEHESKRKWDGPRPKDCSRKGWELL